MKQIICFECGNKSTDYVFYKSIRKYEGYEFKFDLEVETPHCEKCGSQLYDREIEEQIRDKVHNLIKSKMKDNETCTWRRFDMNYDTDCGNTYFPYVRDFNQPNIHDTDLCPWCKRTRIMIELDNEEMEE